MFTNLLSPPELEVRDDARADRDAFIVIITGTLLLYVFHYWGRPDYFIRSGLIDWVSTNVGGTLEEHPGVGAYLYWGSTSLVLRTLVISVVLIALMTLFGGLG